MSDAGNILPQAEIDALFKQATGRSLSPPPEVAAAKMVVTKEEQVTQKAAPPKPVTKAQEVIPPPPPPVSVKPIASAEIAAVNKVLDQLTTTMESLTRRIEAIEKNIGSLSNEKRDYPDYSSTINSLAAKVSNESLTVRQLDKQLATLKKQLKGTPGFAARDQFTCSTCGAHGYLAVPMKCSNCGTEGWWGWYPEK